MLIELKKGREGQGYIYLHGHIIYLPDQNLLRMFHWHAKQQHLSQANN